MSLFEKTELISQAFRTELHETIPSYIVDFDNLEASVLCINTMTVSCKTNLKQLNTFLPFLKDHLNTHPIEDGIILSTNTMGKNAIILKISQKWGDTLQFQKNISAKIFGNGAIHITGVTLPSEAVLVSDYLCKYITTLPLFKNRLYENQDNVIDKDMVQTTEINICMIQSTFDLGEQISLPEAYQKWIKDRSVEKKDFERVIFNPEKHHALHIKFFSVCPSLSAIIFSSGKVIITGARKPGDLSHAFLEVCTFFDKITRPSFLIYPRVVIAKIPKKRGRKRKIDAVDDYDGISLVG